METFGYHLSVVLGRWTLRFNVALEENTAPPALKATSARIPVSSN
jgi:hypothetical protein